MLLIYLTWHSQKWTRHPGRKIIEIKLWCFFFSFSIYLALTWKQLWILWITQQSNMKYYKKRQNRSPNWISPHRQVLPERESQCFNMGVWQIFDQKVRHWTSQSPFNVSGLLVYNSAGRWTDCDTRMNIWGKLTLLIMYLKIQGSTMTVDVMYWYKWFVRECMSSN